MQKVIANEYREENPVEVKVDADNFSIDIRNNLIYYIGYKRKVK